MSQPGMNAPVERSVLILHDGGLHGRPSVKVTKLAKHFGARIDLGLSADGPWIDAKSIVKVMAAKVPQGSRLHIRAAGNDAGDAVAALIGLVQRDFDEAEADAANG